MTIGLGSLLVKRADYSALSGISLAYGAMVQDLSIIGENPFTVSLSFDKLKRTVVHRNKDF